MTAKISLNRISDDSASRSEQRTVKICCRILDVLTSACFSNCSMHRLYLSYSMDPWGCFDCPHVENVHVYACTRILGISSQSPDHMVCDELGRQHLSVLAATKHVKHWLRFDKIPSGKCVKMAHSMLKSVSEEGKENWASAFRDLLCTNSVAFPWWNGSVVDKTRFVPDFQHPLKDFL